MSKLEQARTLIDGVDPQICKILSDFRLCAKSIKQVEVSETIEKKLDGAPIEFLMSLVKYIDFEDLTPDVKEQNLIILAGFVAQRFDAICLVAEDKKENGETEAYDKERHERVLTARFNTIQRYGGNAELGKAAFVDFLDLSVRYQNDFLQERTGPIAQKLVL